MNIPPKLTEVVAAWFRQSNKGLSFSPYVRSCFNGMSKLHCLLPFCDNQPRYVVFEQPHQYCPSNSDLSPDILSCLLGETLLMTDVQILEEVLFHGKNPIASSWEREFAVGLTI
jgi:hypothetical protein